MTSFTRTPARTAVLVVTFLLLLAGVLGSAFAQMTVPARHAAVPVTAPAAAVHPAAPALAPADEAFLAQLLGSADVSPATALDLVEAGQRVCEGITAGVPVAVMLATLQADQHLSPVEAQQLVALARVTYCSGGA